MLSPTPEAGMPAPAAPLPRQPEAGPKPPGRLFGVDLPPNVGDYVIYALWHLACLGVFWVGVSWKALAICAASYFFRMFGLIAGHHRYFSHKSYSLSRPMQFLMALLGTLGAQRGLLWWVASHRHHHQFSDTEEDVHSPILRSLLYAHSGWFLDPKQRAPKLALVPDLAKYPELVWLSDWSSIPVALYGLALYLAFGLEGFIWGFVVSTVLVWHGIHALSSFAHTPGGSRRYPTGDYSRNKFFLALVTLGEGWHNNHHYYPASVRHGFFWWEIDIAYGVLKAMSWVGLVKDMKLPSDRVLRGDLPGLVRRLERFRREVGEVRRRLEEAAGALGGPAAAELREWIGGRLDRFAAAARELFIQVPDEQVGSLAALRREVLEAADRILAPSRSRGEIEAVQKTLGHEIDLLEAVSPFCAALRCVKAPLERPAPAAGEACSLAS